jgi:hypothetical protein
MQRTLIVVVLAGAVLGAAAFVGANANANGPDFFTAGNLLVSRSVYDDNPSNVTVGETLPPGCTSGCASAVADGSYPQVFNNDSVDGSFGITSKVFLDQLTPSGTPVNSLEVPNSSNNGVPPTKDQTVTSFSSKSELALNLSTDGNDVTFMGYLAPVNAIDVSNSNTPGVIDPTNPVTSSFYRVAGDVNAKGQFSFTKTNAYSGNNGRAAILNSAGNVLYTAGNAGNGGNPQPDGVITGTGAQIMTPEVKALVAQNPGAATPVGSFNITQVPGNTSPDKIGKDTNFRGLTISNNVVYFTKGSGGNGINTVYYIDTAGGTCPNGSGVPAPGATLPTTPIAYDPSLVASEGVTPYNMCILNGFPTTLAKKNPMFPFGIWFASPTVLYVADEGSGDNTYSSATNTYTKAAAQTTAGLQKWTLVNGTWKLAYTLGAGLQLGQPYQIPGYPTGNNGDGSNGTTGLPWAPATDGLRNIAGRVNPDGTVTVWAVTSTVSGSGDQGADPNKLVTISDNLAATTLPSSESFTTIDNAGNGEVLRGVSFTPGTTQS